MHGHMSTACTLAAQWQPVVTHGVFGSRGGSSFFCASICCASCEDVVAWTRTSRLHSTWQRLLPKNRSISATSSLDANVASSEGCGV